MNNHTIKNILYTFTSQIIGIIASICMSALIPKVTTVSNFSYWQLFVFYSSFIGLLHFGLIDGIYLKYGGSNFLEINKSKILSQLLTLLFLQSIIIISSAILITNYVSGNEKSILLFVLFYIPIKNIYSYFSMLLLSTNEIIYNSYCDIVRKGFLIISLLLLILIYSNVSYITIISVYLISELIPYIIIIKPYISFFKRKNILSFRESIKESLSYMRIGCFLTLSNIISTLILGIGRFFIKKEWNIETFGKVSLSLSIVFFLIMIITQTSLVLFPIIRRSDSEKRNKLFIDLNIILSSLFYSIFIIYFPLRYLIDLWLPHYTESSYYLSILSLICLYEGKMQLLGVTYLKCLFKQKELMIINTFILIISFILVFTSTYYYHNLILILYSMILCISLRYIITYILLSKYLKIKNYFKNLLTDAFIGIIFLLLLKWFRYIDSFIIITLIIALYYIISKKTFTNIFNSYKR